MAQNNMPGLPPGLIEAVRDLAAALAPPALGSTVAVLLKQGLTWTERFLQICIGTVVSWYALQAAHALFGLEAFMAQAFSFMAGLVAYDALPRFRERAIALIGDLPDTIRQWLQRRREGGQ